MQRRGGPRLGLGERIELLDGLRPHAGALHQAEIGPRRKGDEVARPVEGVVLAQARRDRRLGVGRAAHALRLGGGQRVEPGVLGVVGGERPRRRCPASARARSAGIPSSSGGRDVGGIHRDVPRARFLAVGHLRDLKNLVGQPHRNPVERDRQAARQPADRGVAVVDELEDPVDRGVRVLHVDLAQDRRQALVAPGVARQHRGQEFGRDLRQIGGGGGRNQGKTGDFHKSAGEAPTEAALVAGNNCLFSGSISVAL